MSSEPAEVVVRAEGLGKSYRIGHVRTARYATLRDSIAARARGVLRSARDLANGRPIVAGDDVEEVWALRDVSFDIRRGETIGLIGRNGAGKSTLLKILSRITEPTRGRAALAGRVASLLEVGTGFHPELTGRENVYLNGAILGMSRREVATKFDEIVQFAETERFLDTPVKRYSSGMYVRLAFAVAAHLDPDVLLVDEVLAVGDARFQKKCLGKIDQQAALGRTVVFVSHQMTAVSALCRRAILLESGRIVRDGPTAEVVSEYLRGMAGGSGTQSAGFRAFEPAVEGRGVRLVSAMARARDDAGQPYLKTSDAIEFGVRFDSWLENADLDVTFDLMTDQGVHVWHVGTFCSPARRLAPGSYECVGVVEGHILNAGRYVLHAQFGLDQKYVLLRQEGTIAFDVADDIPGRGANFAPLPGVIHPRISWSVQRLSRAS